MKSYRQSQNKDYIIRFFLFHVYAYVYIYRFKSKMQCNLKEIGIVKILEKIASIKFFVTKAKIIKLENKKSSVSSKKIKNCKWHQLYIKQNHNYSIKANNFIILIV